MLERFRLNFTESKQQLQTELLQEILENTKHKQSRPTPSISNAQYGDRVVKKARSWGKYTHFSGAGAPALDQATVVALGRCKDEHELVALLTRPLEDILDKSVHLVNSEEFRWLQTSEDTKYNQKPDMFICHPAMYTKQDPWTRATKIKNRSETDKFGKLSDWALRDCLAATLEAKLKITNQAIGEAANYGDHILAGDYAPLYAKLVLFDKTKFLLMVAFSQGHFDFIECTWTTPGSKKLLRDFPVYDNPWTVLVKEACQKWQLEIARDDNGSAWLGKGATGRVFRVKKAGSDKQMALKVVEKEKVSQLSIEKEMLRNAAAKCDFVMPIEEAMSQDPDFAMLMSHVGTPVEQNQYQDVITLLSKLHQKRFLHGDPRLANVVVFEDKLYWIDFMDVRVLERLPPDAALQADMRALVNSLSRNKLSEDVTKAVDKYDGTDTATTALISALQKENTIKR
jgi:hypothetical protein